MARIYLVRHGEPENRPRDPGLTALGMQQADAAADQLASMISAPIAVASSPLRRAQQTAAPLSRRWGEAIDIVDAVRELPSPSDEPEARQRWLRMAMRSTFAELDPLQNEWRVGILHYLTSCPQDTVVFSHAVVVNVVVGYVEGHDRVLDFIPAHASVTIVDADDRGLILVERGAGRASGGGPVA